MECPTIFLTFCSLKAVGGTVNFARCPHRDVTLIDAPNFNELFYDTEDSANHATSAQLTCPKVRSLSGPEASSPKRAQLELMKKAGQSACRGCPFPRMSTLEVDEAITTATNAKSERLIAEARLAMLRNDPDARIQDGAEWSPRSPIQDSDGI